MDIALVICLLELHLIATLLPPPAISVVFPNNYFFFLSLCVSLSVIVVLSSPLVQPKWVSSICPGLVCLLLPPFLYLPEVLAVHILLALHLFHSIHLYSPTATLLSISLVAALKPLV